MRPTHAGGVVFRRQTSGREYLVVQSSVAPLPGRGGPGPDWVLPKGHIDPGEGAEEAALREVREEGAVEAEIVATLGTSSYVRNGTPVHAVFYLMRALHPVPPTERRAALWLPFTDARSRLTYADTRGLLDAAEGIEDDGRPRAGGRA